MKQMVGPVYSSGKIKDERKHHFTDGYVAPISRERREEQVKLVTKYFQKEKKVTDTLKQKIIDKTEKLSESYIENANKISREEALKLGEARRKEALQRREMQVKMQAEKKSSMSIQQSYQSSSDVQVGFSSQQHTYDSSAVFDQDIKSVNITPFSLKKEVGAGIEVKSEQNTTAISYQEFIQKKEQFKSARATLVDKSKGDMEHQIVFAKEFSPANRPKNPKLLEMELKRAQEAKLKQEEEILRQQKEQEAIQKEREWAEAEAQRLKLQQEQMRKQEEEKLRLKMEQERIQKEKERREAEA